MKETAEEFIKNYVKYGVGDLDWIHPDQRPTFSKLIEPTPSYVWRLVKIVSKLNLWKCLCVTNGKNNVVYVIQKNRWPFSLMLGNSSIYACQPYKNEWKLVEVSADEDLYQSLKSKY